MAKGFFGVLCIILLALAASMALLSVPALAQVAEEAQPVLPADAPPGAQLAPPDAIQSQPEGVYHVKLACYDGEKLIMESEIAVLEGFTAQIENTRWRYPGVAFSGLILIDAEKPYAGLAHADEPPVESVAIPMPAVEVTAENAIVGTGGGGGAGPGVYSPELPPAILDAAQHFSFAGLRFTVYCPGADRFEAEVSWSEPTYSVWFPQGDQPVMFNEPPESEWDYLGRLSAALNTPDQGVVDPGGYMQPLGAPAPAASNN